MMRTDTRPIQITIADLQADAEGIIRSLPESGEVVVISANGEVVATLAAITPIASLTHAQVAEIRQAIADFEKEEPSEWIDHEEAMRIFDENIPTHTRE
jgi:antitoxin (DNA-binding transcriptional repressor) of toxin-antitoxin stability system